jgi:hypothetical protein
MAVCTGRAISAVDPQQELGFWWGKEDGVVLRVDGRDYPTVKPPITSARRSSNSRGSYRCGAIKMSGFIEVAGSILVERLRVYGAIGAMDLVAWEPALADLSTRVLMANVSDKDHWLRIYVPRRISRYSLTSWRDSRATTLL